MKTLYWSRKPGNFVNKMTGKEYEFLKDSKGETIGPKFTGSVREWYETLTETMIDCASGMKAAKVYVGADVMTIFECSVLYKMNLDKKLPYDGKLTSRFEVYKDNRMPRNEIKLMEGTDARKVIVTDMNII